MIMYAFGIAYLSLLALGITIPNEFSMVLENSWFLRKR